MEPITGEEPRRQGFRGVRNTDTSAARIASAAARTQKRLDKNVEELRALGYTIIPPEPLKVL